MKNLKYDNIDQYYQMLDNYSSWSKDALEIEINRLRRELKTASFDQYTKEEFLLRIEVMRELLRNKKEEVMKEEIIEVKEDIVIKQEDGTKIILEKGDKIRVLNERNELSIYAKQESPIDIILRFQYRLGDKRQGVSIKLESLSINNKTISNQTQLENNFLARKLFFNGVDNLYTESGFHGWDMATYKNYLHAFRSYTNFNLFDDGRESLLISGDLSQVSESDLDSLEDAISNL